MDADELNRATYEAIAGAYAARTTERLGFLSEALDRLCSSVVTGGRVVDLGCGPGHDVHELRRRGLDALGVDLSPGMLRAGRPGAALVLGDLRALPLRDSCLDGVWSSYALLHIRDDDLPRVLAEVARVLRPGGTAVLVTASAGGGRERVSYAPEHERVFYARSDEALAAVARAAGLDVLEAVCEPDAWRAPVRVVARRAVPAAGSAA